MTALNPDHSGKLRTLLKYLSGTKFCVLTLRPKIKLHEKMTSLDIETYVDSDWAGCVQTRKSTSGIAIYFLGALITTQSKTQQTLAPSSGEAELYAIGLGTSESLFVKSLLLETELAQKVNIRVYTDSTAGTSMSTRFGTSKKTRHVQLRFLYIRELVLQGVLQGKEVLGTSNPADVMTKYVSKETLLKHLGALGVSYPFGRQA